MVAKTNRTQPLLMDINLSDQTIEEPITVPHDNGDADKIHMLSHAFFEFSPHIPVHQKSISVRSKIRYSHNILLVRIRKTK